MMRSTRYFIVSQFVCFFYFLSPAIAQAAQGSVSENMVSQLIFFGFMGIVMYFFIIRPQTKNAKTQQILMDSLTKDDEIVTSSGLLGVVTQVNALFVKAMIAEGVEVIIQKHMVTALLPKGTRQSLKTLDK